MTMTTQRGEPTPLSTLTISCLHDIVEVVSAVKPSRGENISRVQSETRSLNEAPTARARARALDSRKSDRPCSINDMRFSERPAPCATCACVMPAFSRASRRFFPKTAAAEGSACRLRVAFLGVDVIANRSCSLGQTPTNTLAIL